MDILVAAFLVVVKMLIADFSDLDEIPIFSNYAIYLFFVTIKVPRTRIINFCH